MGDNLDWRNVGEQMKSALTDALQTGNFKQLNNLVSQTVTDALNEVGIHIMPDNRENSATDGRKTGSNNKYSHTVSGQTADRQNAYGGGQRTNGQNIYYGQNEEDRHNIHRWQKVENGQRHADGQNAYGGRQTADRQNHGQRQKNKQNREWRQADGQAFNRGQANAYMQNNGGRHENRQAAPPKNVPAGYPPPAYPVKLKQVGSISHVMYRFFGGIGFGITLIAAFLEITTFLALDFFSMTGCAITLFFLTFFFGMIRLGIAQKNRLARAKRYVQLCGKKMFEDIKKLAGGIGQKERFVVKDIRKMLKIGMFPEGHLDDGNTCFMLNDNIYRQYLETSENHRQKKAIKELKEKDGTTTRQTNQNIDSENAADSGGKVSDELDDMISEGMEYIRKLKSLNDRISGEAITAKLFRLENLLKDIFERVREHPEQMNRMQKLMSYYLPTTLKLIETYEDFEQVGEPGKEIVDAKAEIENTIDTINQAFTELLNNLFRDAVFDATTDAQVLKTMLAREGLTNEMELAANETKK